MSGPGPSSSLEGQYDSELHIGLRSRLYPNPKLCRCGLSHETLLGGPAEESLGTPCRSPRMERVVAGKVLKAWIQAITGLGFLLLLGGSWDLVSKVVRVVSTLIGVISTYIISIVTLFITLLTISPMILQVRTYVRYFGPDFLSLNNPRE